MNLIEIQEKGGPALQFRVRKELNVMVPTSKFFCGNCLYISDLKFLFGQGIEN